MARAIHITDAAEVRDAHFWRHAILAGLIGGAVFMMAEMLMVMLIGESPWGPPRMIAAMVLGPDVLPAQGAAATFDMGILMTAMMIHFPLSILYGLLIGAVVQRTSMRSYMGALTEGAAIGLVIYLVNFYFIASFAFEWFAMARNWVSLVTHAMFGLVTAWAFLGLAEPQPHPASPAR
ncbi:MAG: hypothetical protein AB7N70_16410 [Dehalococcoidia bacterium]